MLIIFLIGPLTRRFGEQVLLRAGAVIFMLGMAMLIGAASLVSYALVIIGVAFQGAGSALILTSMQSLVSMRADREDRGLVMGLFSGTGTFGRTVGTLLTGTLFSTIHPQAPYTVGILLMAALVLIVLVIGTRIQTEGVVPAKT